MKKDTYTKFAKDNIAVGIANVVQSLANIFKLLF